MFYPYVTISATQARVSDDQRYVMSPFFSLSFFFFGRAKNLGICEATKDSSGASSKKRDKMVTFGGAFEFGQPAHGVVT